MHDVARLRVPLPGDLPGVQDSGDIVDPAAHDKVSPSIELELIDQRGSFYSYGDIRLGQGRENAKEFLRENLDMMDEIDMSIRQQTLSGLLPMPIGEEEELEASEG